MTGDPVGRLLQVGMLGGFRYRGQREAPLLVALITSDAEPDWRDSLDLTTGTFTYYGDNRRPGRDLHDSPHSGNVALRRTFDRAQGTAEDRRQVGMYFRGQEVCILEEDADTGRAAQETSSKPVACKPGAMP